MISFKANGKYLELGKIRLGIQYKNPIFNRNNIPGIITYPFRVPAGSKVNRSLFKHPQVSSSTAFVNSIDDVQMYVNNVLWKIGKLNILGGDSETYELNFQSDSADLSDGMKNLKLSDISLGTDSLDYDVVDDIYPDVNYALFTVKWDDFYGDTNPDFLGYINYYDGGFPVNTTTVSEYAVIPFPYLHHILERMFAHFGYLMVGDILTDNNFNRLVVMNNYTLDKLNGSNINTYESSIDFISHVPDMTLGNFVAAVKAKLGLDFIFDATKKQVNLVKIEDTLNDQGYIDKTSQASPNPNWGVNDYDGMTFSDEYDSNDALKDIKDVEWAKYRIGNGKEKIKANLSSMLMNNHTDPIEGARTINVPWVKGAGSSPEFELGVNGMGLRLMYNNGIVGNVAQGDYATATESLRWKDGSIGAYDLHYAAWDGFKASTRQEQFDMRFTIKDLMNINPLRKWQINHQRYFWSNMRISIDNEEGIKSAKVDMYRVKL